MLWTEWVPPKFTRCSPHPQWDGIWRWGLWNITGVRWALMYGGLNPIALGWLISSTVDSDSWAADQLRDSRLQLWSQGDLCSWSSTNTGSSLPWIPSPDPPAGPLPQPMAACWLTPNSQWRLKCSTRTSSGTATAPGMSSSYTEWLNGMSLPVRAWQNVVHWRTTSISLSWEPHEQDEKAKRYDTERWIPQVSRCPILRVKK